MMLAMTDGRYEDFGKYMETVSPEIRRNISYNIRCYDLFLTYPDDAPQEEIDIVKKISSTLSCRLDHEKSACQQCMYHVTAYLCSMTFFCIRS